MLALAERLCAPMVLTLKAKEDLERENPFAVGQSGLIGNPAAQRAFERCELLLMLGTDFPYTDWYPKGKRVIQVDRAPGHIGRRTHVELGVVGDTGLAAAGLLGRVAAQDRPRPPRGLHGPLRELARRGSASSPTPNYDSRGDRREGPLGVRQPRRPDPARGGRRRRSTGTPPTTRSSPATPGCRPYGWRGS